MTHIKNKVFLQVRRAENGYVVMKEGIELGGYGEEYVARSSAELKDIMRTLAEEQITTVIDWVNSN